MDENDYEYTTGDGDLSSYLDDSANILTPLITKHFAKKRVKNTIIATFVGGVLSLSTLDGNNNIELRNGPDIIELVGEYGNFLCYQEEISEQIEHLIPDKEMLTYNIIREIFGFKSLTDNWDGYGALPTSVLCALNSETIIRNIEDPLIISKLSDIYPNTNGTVSMLWENSLGDSVSLSVGHKTMSYYVDIKPSDTLYFNNVDIMKESIDILSNYIKAV